VVDRRFKYIWYSQTGREQLFDLQADPQELCDLAPRDDAEQRLKPYRNKLIEILRDRPEAFTDGTRLVPGRTHDFTIPGYEPGKCFPFV
jgi:hypothetical protein